MVFQNDSSTEKDSCCRENLHSAATVLQWKQRPATSCPEVARACGSARVEHIREGGIDFIPLLIPLDKAKVMPIDKFKQAINPSQSIEAVKPESRTTASALRRHIGSAAPLPGLFTGRGS